MTDDEKTQRLVKELIAEAHANRRTPYPCLEEFTTEPTVDMLYSVLGLLVEHQNTQAIHAVALLIDYLENVKPRTVH